MKYYKAVLSYDGANYSGWQKQPGQRTIQGSIEDVLKKISKSEEVQVIGSGRTDAGVHAFSQVARLMLPLEIEEKALLRGMNSLLDKKIRVKSIEPSSENFNPVFDCIKKEYHYFFKFEDEYSPFAVENIVGLDTSLDLDKLNEACSLFVGEHDFLNYFTTGTPVKSTVRKIFECRVEHVRTSGESFIYPEEYYVFKISGNGFLKQMVRLIIGCIWSYARGNVTQDDILDSFSRKLTNKLAPTAPSRGLYLYQATY